VVNNGFHFIAPQARKSTSLFDVKNKDLNIIISNYICGFLETEVVVRKWGNSLGITLPKEIVDKQRIRENERLFIGIQKEKTPKVSDIFGITSGWNIDTQKMKDKTREEDAKRDKKIPRHICNH